MAKRPIEETAIAFYPHDASHLAKKQKMTQNSTSSVSSNGPSRIFSSRDIHICLAFHPDTEALRAGIQNFKPFLEAIAYPTDPLETKVVANIKILQEYLDSQKPKEGLLDQEALHIRDLIQSWHYASDQNDDNLVSSSTAILALLLKAISGILELREHGTSICHTILRPDQLYLVAKCLSAPPHKAHVISPSLRLLTEVTSFDGGTVARTLYVQRDKTFDARTLARNLSLTTKFQQDETHKKPSIRSNAIRYLLANLKFQAAPIKVDITKLSTVMKCLFDGLATDPVDQVAHVFSVLNEYIIRNDHISWTDKSYLLAERNLASLSNLYRAKFTSDVLQGSTQTIQQVFEQVMIHICTVPDAGLVKNSQGWYQLDSDIADVNSHEVQLPLSVSHENSIHQLVLRNHLLARLIQSLRPHSNIGELNLVLSSFKACPELVADFWIKKISFTFDPKLTNTWIGYASLVFESIRLPVPRYFGKRHAFSSHPPPVPIAIENLLPTPLTQTSLSRCISHGSTLINLFGVRILTLAIQKLSIVLTSAIEAHRETNSDLWSDWRSILASEFMRRCPSMKDVILLFYKLQNADPVCREAIARLVALYFEHIPALALEEKVDITNVTTKLLQAVESSDVNAPDFGFRLTELEHVVNAIRRSTSFNWWIRPEYLKYSPTMTFLCICVRDDSSNHSAIRELVRNALQSTGIVQALTKSSSVQVLIDSIRNQTSPDKILPFLDNCFVRFARRPLVYEDNLNRELEKNAIPDDLKPISLICMTIVEQWQYLDKSWKGSEEEICCWLADFVRGLIAIGEDERAHEHLMQLCLSKLTHSLSGQKLLQKFKDTPLKSSSSSEAFPSRTTADTTFNSTATGSEPLLSMIAPFQVPRLPKLSKIRTMDLESVVDSSAVSKLILCLSTNDQSVRIQSHQTLDFLLARMMTAVQSREMIYLLLGELSETAHQSPGQPLPFLVTSYVLHCLPVLADPANPLFPKLAVFLTTRPNWHPHRLVRHLLESTLLQEPSQDTDVAPWKEAIWLLNWLCDGMRTQRDAEILRSVGAWERLISFGSSHASLGPSTVQITATVADLERVGRLQARVRSLILRLVMLAVRDGQQAGTLITRVGGLAWLDSWKAMRWISEEVWLEMRKLLVDNIGQSVQDWSFGDIVSS